MGFGIRDLCVEVGNGRRWPKLIFQMVNQAQRESEDRHRRIRIAAGRKYRRSGDEEVGDSVNAALRIDHTVSGAVMHASRAHMVIPPAVMAT